MAITVKFIAGTLAGKAYPLGTAPVLIGRSRECNIVMPKTYSRVSKRHVTLEAKDGRIFLTNLSTHANTTRVGSNVVPPQHRAPVFPGDEVRLGPDGEIAFRIEREDDNATVAGFGFQAAGDAPTGNVAPVTHAHTMTLGTVAPGMQTITLGTVAPGMRQTEFTAAKTGAASMSRATMSQVPNDDCRTGTFDRQVTQDSRQEPETRPLETVFVNPDEIKKLLEEANRKRKMRSTMRFFAVGVVLCVAATLYYAVRPKPERVLTWPLDESGAYSVRIFKLPVPSGKRGETSYDGFSITVPWDDRLSVSTNRTASHVTFKVATYIGAKRDVPFFIETECRRDKSFVQSSGKALFDAYRKKLQDEGSWNLLSVKPMSFIGGGNGVPYFETRYLRTLQSESSSEQRFGHLLFVAYGDMTITVKREIPAIEQWRGSSLIAREVLLSANESIRDLRWEGREDHRDSTVAELLSEADGYLSRKAPQLWKDVEFLLQSAMIKSVLSGSDPSPIMTRLKALRKKERMEFRRIRAQWEHYSRLGDKAACDATIAEALKIFSDRLDRRHWFLLKGAWR